MLFVFVLRIVLFNGFRVVFCGFLLFVLIGDVGFGWLVFAVCTLICLMFLGLILVGCECVCWWINLVF